MQKEGFPVVVAPEMSERSRPKKHVILTSWASVATALLLVVLIGGAFYVADLKTRECDGSSESEEHKTQDYSRKFINEDDSEVNEDIHVDEDEQTELITTKTKDGNIDMIYALDYRTKISAAYIPSAEECLLLAGEDAQGLDSWGTEKTETEHVAKENLFETDYRSSGNRVTDLSILPRAVKPYCQGKDCFWAELVDEDDEDDEDDEGALTEEETEEGGVRKKRSTWCYIRHCYTYRCGWWRRCTSCYNKACYGVYCNCWI